MKPFISYLKSVIRAVTCGSIYLFWLWSSLTPSAIEAASGITKPLSYYITIPFSSCLLMMVTMAFLHHIITVPLNWAAAVFPKWVSGKFNPNKRWYWPTNDSWNEGYDAGIVCLLGVFLSGASWLLATARHFETLSGEGKIKTVLSFTLMLNPELAGNLAELFGATLVDNGKELIMSAFASDFNNLKIVWLIIAVFNYQYLNHDRSLETAPKPKDKAKKKTQAKVVEADPIEQELNQLSAEMGTIKMKSVRKPKT